MDFKLPLQHANRTLRVTSEEGLHVKDISTKMAKDKENQIRKIYSPPEEQMDMLRKVYRRYSQMKDKRAEVDTKWDGWEKQYNAERTVKGPDDWKSNIFIPMTASVIEAQLSELIGQELRPWVIERGSEDAPKAQVANAIMDYTWEVAKSDVALIDIIKDALILGTGIGQEYYRRDYRTVKDKKGNETKVIEYDDCYLEPVKLQDFFVDERARSFSNSYPARDCIRRHIMDIDDFKKFFTGKTWNPFDSAQYVRPGGDTNYYEFYKPPERLEHDKEVEVLWYWNRMDDQLAIVANDVLVSDGPNPYKHKQLPFVRATDIKRTHQFYGRGEAELVESLQEETNTLRRMIVDRNHLDIDKPILVSDTLTLEDEDAITRPHGIIPVGDVNSAKPLEYGDIPRSVFLSLEMLNEDKVRITGMDERQQSVSTAGTATEAAILKEATLKRLGMKVWQLKNDTLVDIGRLRMANIMQFYSQPKLEAITGEDLVAKVKSQGRLVLSDGKTFAAKYRNIRLKDQMMTVNPQTKQPQVSPAKGYTFFEADPKFFLPSAGSFDVRYKATSALPLSKPLEQQKADELYDRLAQNPVVDQWAIAEYLIKTRDEDPDKYRKQQPGQAKPEGASLQQMVDLAGIENDEMLRGNALPPTPYASTIHTEMHISFMQSERFKKEVPVEDSKVVQNFANHVMGEIAAQTQRGSRGMETGATPGGMPGQMPADGTVPPQDPAMGDVAPGRIEGGGEVPNGIQGANSGVNVGRPV
jgi:hypothetical protein